MLLIESPGCTLSMALITSYSFFSTTAFSSLVLMLLWEMSDVRASPGNQVDWTEKVRLACMLHLQKAGENRLTEVPLGWWDQAPDVSHSLQAATTLATSSAEPPTFDQSQKSISV